ncbi:MAG: hypothetical protein Q9184_006864 [Pyrenodesmia sp. 2 TL-2023]
MLPSLLSLLLLLPSTLAATLTLTLPPSAPSLPPSTHAQLITHGHILTAPLTRANNFVFRNLTHPGDYNLEIYCRDFDFEPGVVVVPRKEGDAVEVYRRNRKTNARGGRIFPGEGWAVEVKLGRRREYYEKRGGLDPEMKAEFEEQQKKSTMGNIAGGGNPLQSFDMAGWMAGQTSGGKEEEVEATVTSGREKDPDRGKGGGKGKRRRG